MARPAFHSCLSAECPRLGSSDSVSFAGGLAPPLEELTPPGSGLRFAWARLQSCPRLSAENTWACRGRGLTGRV